MSAGSDSADYFNPRSLAGATLDTQGFRQIMTISIHAPSRERQRVSSIALPPKDFNPRSLAGATSRTACFSWWYPFQSTLPRGSDLEYYVLPFFENIFQSTLPRGSDFLAVLSLNHLFISIHAPSRERREAG